MQNDSKLEESTELEYLTWIEAEKILKKTDLVVFALGARMKEHGPHLPLNNDYLLAEYLKKEVMKKVNVVVLPTLQYGFYPSFLEYPGSISINVETFQNMIVDVCKSMNGYGIRKFYVINTGISTLKPLEQVKKNLEENNMLFDFTNLLEIEKAYDQRIIEQEGGTHADEIETSIMLYIAPDKVNLQKARKDYDSRPNRKGLTREKTDTAIYSPSGTWGDPTLATKEKGKIFVEKILEAILLEILKLKENRN